MSTTGCGNFHFIRVGLVEEWEELERGREEKGSVTGFRTELHT